MTIDEAIKHAEEVADFCEHEVSKYDMSDPFESHMACQDGKCAEEHRQLAAWLKELKAYKEQTDGDLISRQDAIKCFNVRELKFKDKEDAELMKHYLELSFNNLTKLPSIDVRENRINGDLISRQAVIDIVEFECGEWRGLAKTIIKAIKDVPSKENTADSILEDIKVEIEKEIISGDSIDYINGLNMALMIINEKHISGKEK